MMDGAQSNPLVTFDDDGKAPAKLASQPDAKAPTPRKVMTFDNDRSFTFDADDLA